MTIEDIKLSLELAENHINKLESCSYHDVAWHSGETLDIFRGILKEFNDWSNDK